MKPRDILKAVYDELDAQGMLRGGDDGRYQMLDQWFTMRLEGLSEELEYFREPQACYDPYVDCGGYCDYPWACPVQCVPPDPLPEGGAGGMEMPIPLAAAGAAMGGGVGGGGTFGAGGGVGGGDIGMPGGGPVTCPPKEEYRIAR